MPTITVTGTAKLKSRRMKSFFSLDVTKTDKDLQVAKRFNDETVGKVLELTRPLFSRAEETSRPITFPLK
jgi:uncharacterized protein YggE